MLSNFADEVPALLEQSFKFNKNDPVNVTTITKENSVPVLFVF